MPFPPCFGFIPARYASTRFPGKPLADILGKPMFWHVWERAMRCERLTGVYLCTDDARIAEAASAYGVPCLMTREDHENGSSRIHEAAGAVQVPENAVVVNIQGDEPALDPAMLDALLEPFADPLAEVATLACPIDREEARLTDRVKVVRGNNGNALYFSRAMIPHERNGAGQTPSPYLLHVGIYAYRMRSLSAYASLRPSVLERLESLEQLRFLENGIPIRIVLTEHRSHGVDRPEDLEKILPLLSEGQ